MKNQSNALYAAIYLADFPAQAIIRLRHDLRARPVAILEGVTPHERVCSFNVHARKRGVVTGVTRLQVEELGGIYVQSRSVKTENAAKMILLENVSQFSPRIEEVFASNASGFVLDISGTERLFGTPAMLANRFMTSIHSLGFRASIAVSHNFDTARIKASFSRGITIIPQQQEAEFLSTMPIAALPLDEEDYKTFVVWGIGNLGELADLPEEELIARLGQRARHWLRLARGVEEHLFQPIEAKFELKEHIEFDSHIEQLDSLMFIAATMINNLIARSTSRALALSSLAIHMDLERELTYERVIRPAIPSCDRMFFLKLLQLQIAAHPPQSAIRSLTLTADSGQLSKVQQGLFSQKTPEPSRLDVTLARLKALVGDERVGSPQLIDTHRSDSFVVENFRVPNQTVSPANTYVRVSLRRIRPPQPIRMQLQFAKPEFFHVGTDQYRVDDAYGPWLTSGCWWSVNEWDSEEWDVVAINSVGESIACLIVHDRLKKQWLLDALYD